MERLECINQLLAIKDVVYGLLEWAEHLSDEEFEEYCKLEQPLPEEMVLRLEAFCKLSESFGSNCREVLERLEQLCKRC